MGHIQIAIVHIHYTTSSKFSSANDNDDTFSFNKRANITFNYNPRAAKSILGPRIAPILNAITTIHLIRDVSQPNDNIMQNENLNFPVETGFKHLQRLQHWIQDRFQKVVNELSSGNLNKEITDEILKVGVVKLEIRPIMKEKVIENGNELVESNAKRHIRTRNGKNPGHDIDYKANTFPSTNNDAYLEKIYAIMRIFVSGIPWIRENTMLVDAKEPHETKIGVTCGGGEWSDGVFENVVAEIFDDQFEQ
ncbi:3576_t:CDS:2 [Ambispora leptoticha]|uniref:3576_t:CDS:1 n=1 Tax=Ambispora leptoticha TaxID=144679 RepID=A0A9N9AD85_9GLOM|nr:3576_t:CDS:2 [Ambispora leptoticha]